MGTRNLQSTKWEGFLYDLSQRYINKISSEDKQSSWKCQQVKGNIIYIYTSLVLINQLINYNDNYNRDKIKVRD